VIRLILLRHRLKRWDRFVDDHLPQFVFEKDCFLRRKRCWIVKGRDREIDRVGIFAVFEKQMRAATRGKRTNPVRVRNFARFTLRDDQILAAVLIPTARKAHPRFAGNRCNDS
jgi:hypothetical protein